MESGEGETRGKKKGKEGEEEQQSNIFLAGSGSCVYIHIEQREGGEREYVCVTVWVLSGPAASSWLLGEFHKHPLVCWALSIF